MELKGTNKIRNSQLDIMFNPRFNAYYRDLYSLNSRSTILGSVVMKQYQNQDGWSHDGCVHALPQEFQDLKFHQCTANLTLCAKNMMHGGQECWCGLSE